MPIKLKYDELLKILTAEVSGLVVIEDFYKIAPQIVSDPRFSSNVNMIWDVRQMDSASFTREFAESLIKLRVQIADKRGDARLAIVASDDLAYGMSRMYQGMTEGDFRQSLNVFREPEEASAWINSTES